MPTISQTQAPLFFNALLANTIFSGFCGLIMTLQPDHITQWLDAGTEVFIRSTGMGLLLFAAGLLLISLYKRINKTVAWLIITGDMLWVIGSILLVSVWGHFFSIGGALLIIGVALAVLTFGALQVKGLLQI